MVEIEFSPAMFRRFKTAYNKAVAGKDKWFTFDERDYATGYTKYLIEHLEPKFKNKH